MKFLPNEFYHVYNRGNNKQLLFIEEENYRFFLQKLQKELHGSVSIVAYCLMPNHYHLLLYTDVLLNDEKSNILTRKLGTLQSSYTRAFNIRFNRTGSLFQQKFKCKTMDATTRQAETCFHYIHQNPLKAKLVDCMEDWKFSSYDSYCTNAKVSIEDRKIAYDLLAIPESRALFIKESLGVITFNEEE